MVMGPVVVIARGALNELTSETTPVKKTEDAASARAFGAWLGFDPITYKENLLHHKISFLFALIPRPNYSGNELNAIINEWEKPF